jgi:hypothetical protein
MLTKDDQTALKFTVLWGSSFCMSAADALNDTWQAHHHIKRDRIPDKEPQTQQSKHRNKIPLEQPSHNWSKIPDKEPQTQHFNIETRAP